MTQKYVNFKLFLILSFFCLNNPIFSQEKIIKSGDEWRFYDKAIPPKNGWINSSRITSTWKKGISGLGYGDKAVTTVIDFGKDPDNKRITAYFSKGFQIDNPHDFVLYQVNIEKDDGIVLYLNGKEIFRKDMPIGKIHHDTKASGLIVSGQSEAFLHTIFITPEDLRRGENIISASVHQGTEKSEDLIFNLELFGLNTQEALPTLIKERSIKNSTLDLRLKNLSYKHELEKKEFQYELMKQEKNSHSVYLIFLLFIFLSLTSVLAYALILNRKKLTAANTKNDILEKQNQFKDAEIMDISLNSINNKNFLKEIKKELGFSIQNKSLSIVNKEIQKIIGNIDFNLDTSENWSSLKNHFDAIHSGYLDKLKSLYPNLSDIELRHCIFIKLRLQTKEIANILHIDPRSVQSARYRIKKKMNLDENTNLKDYLLNINS
ncbi:helix-turn-helix transcriptional regulator [Tenacibaculum xiamenense]|uniref:helix-turn-helix transcriptional regulator n=1 Tax=Tenacibaculum xiamenense TaxID=1261553 RepID=UPI003895D980